MRLSRVIFKLCIAAFLIALVIWGASMIKCEVLTALHGTELIDVYEENEEISYWISGYDWAKVISYSDESACVYYVFNAEMGMTVSYIYNDGVWEPKENSIDAMRSLWSADGNGTETIWPYWYHGLF